MLLLENKILKKADIGDIVFLGVYEQDDITFNGKEAIEWLVLAKENNKILVISDKALDCQPYNTTDTYVTWENCSLREWLNSTFFSSAFSTEEQSLILDTNVSADKNPEYNVDPGNATTDKVFLLSINDVEKYFASDEYRWCSPTSYAKKKGAYISTGGVIGGVANCMWWLRSSVFYYGLPFATIVGESGLVSYESVSADDACVRPAMWIEVSD